MKVAVFFGGRSVEHEVSVISGIQVCKTLGLEHEVIPVYLTKENQMYVDNELLNSNHYIDLELNKRNYVDLQNSNGAFLRYKTFPHKKIYFDIALLCVHGKGVEDGSLSSLFELLNIPYVGPSILSGAVSQNKAICKKTLKYHKVNMIDFELINEVNKNKIIDKLTFPSIVKANNLGSSIGISVVNDKDELLSSLDAIFRYDQEVIVEKYIKNKKEYNIALYKNKNSINLSLIEEVSGGNILSYNDKYLDNSSKSQRIIPANISNSLKREIEYNAKKIYYALGCNNLVRLDFIYDEDSKKLYFNEINSIPGSYAFYLFKDKKTFIELLNELINNSLNEYDYKNSLISTIDNNKIFERKTSLKFK